MGVADIGQDTDFGLQQIGERGDFAGVVHADLNRNNLLVTTAGSVASQMLQTRPAASPSEYEAALASLLIGELGAAENVKVTADKYKVQVIIANPGINGRTNRADSCLGGPLAQITATLAAIAWNRPFIINKEERSPKRQLIELEVIA